MIDAIKNKRPNWEKFVGLRFQKRITLIPGVRLNIGMKGCSLSLGPRGFSLNVGLNKSIWKCWPSRYRFIF